MERLVDLVVRCERNRILPVNEGQVDALAWVDVSAPIPQLPTIAEVMRDPSASRWLRLALRDALDRDCVDAVNDAEVLLALLKARNDEIAKSFGPGVRF